MMNEHDYFERAEQEICDEYNRGEMNKDEFDTAMRDLRDEFRMMADDAADSARQAFYGGY